MVCVIWELSLESCIVENNSCWFADSTFNLEHSALVGEQIDSERICVDSKDRLPCLETFLKPWLNWSLIESISRTAFGLTLNSGATQVKPDLTVIQNCVVEGFCVLGIKEWNRLPCLNFFKPWLNRLVQAFWTHIQYVYHMTSLPCVVYYHQRISFPFLIHLFCHKQNALIPVCRWVRRALASGRQVLARFNIATV